MAHNARVRAPGGWTGDLLPSELRALDLLQKQLLSKRGGAWAPTSPIEIGGAQGLEITGPGYFDQVIGAELASGVHVEYDSYEIEREHLVYPGSGVGFAVRQILYNLNTGFFLGSMDAPALVQTDADDVPATTPRWWIPLGLPAGSVIMKLSVTLSGQFAHNRDERLPATMPRVALARADHDEDGQHFGTPTFDASATMADYRVAHDLEVTTIASPTYDGTQLWWAVIDGEYGTDSAPGLHVLSVRTTVIQTTHDEFQI